MKFLVIGSLNVIQYKDVFPYFKNGEVWLGATGRIINFDTDEDHKKIGNIYWFTNLRHDVVNPPLELTRKFNEFDYKKYDNYDAIEVSRVKDIPMDYYSVIGVPVTFLDKYCPEQFEIIVVATGNSWRTYPETLKSLGFNPEIKYGGGLGVAILGGKAKYCRLMIRRRK